MNKLTLIASAAALTLLAACDKRDDQTVGQAIDQSAHGDPRSESG
jgi:nitrous oxide reductase accessory protein NosL